MEQVQSRREKLREAAFAEIKQIAWEQAAQEGAAALSLRGIAKQMGMSAPALYNYYGSRDELVTALIVDAYSSLAAALAKANAAFPKEEYGERFREVVETYRNWALQNPQQFVLIYGTPIPGYKAPEEITLPASLPATDNFLMIMEEAWRAGAVTIPAEYAHVTSATHQRLQHIFAKRGFTMPEPLWHIVMVGWSQINGMISLELYGHLNYWHSDPGLVYHAEIVSYLRRLGLTVKD